MGKLNQKWLVVIAVLFGTSTVILNNSMLNPVLPTFMHLFDSDAVGVGWILTMFMIAMGMTMPLTGYLGDRYGKKNVYIADLIIFMVCSIIGATSVSLPMIIIARAIQGVAGGLMMPNAMALIFQAFPKNERGFAVGIYGIAVMVAPAIGPLIGGVIAENFDWFYLFLLNIPVAIVSLYFSMKYLKPTPANKEIKFDVPGFILVTIGVGAIMFALGQMRDVETLLNVFNLTLVIVGMLFIVIFIRYKLKLEQLLLDLSVFKVSTYRNSIIVTAAASVGLFSALFLLPYLVQEAYGLSMVETGFLFLPSAIASGIFMTIGGKILDTKGPKYVVPIGLAIVSFASVLFGLINITTAFWVIILINLIHGFGLGFGNMPATTAGMNAIPDKLVTQGSAINNLIRQVVSSLAIVLFSIYFEVRRGHIMLSSESMAFEQATLQAINEAFIIAAILVALAIPAAYRMKGYQDEK